MRDLLTAKEQQLHLHSWQLRQLVPDEVGGLPRAPQTALGVGAALRRCSQ